MRWLHLGTQSYPILKKNWTKSNEPMDLYFSIVNPDVVLWLTKDKENTLSQKYPHYSLQVTSVMQGSSDARELSMKGK